MKLSMEERIKDFLLIEYLAQHPKPLKISQYFELIDFLILEKIIPPKHVRIYTVVNEYKFSLGESQYKNKTELIKNLALELGLHENTVWNIIRDHYQMFERKVALSKEKSR